MRLVRSVASAVRRPRQAVVRGDSVYISSYADDCVVCLPWPRCDRVLRVFRAPAARGIAFHADRLFVASYGSPRGLISCFHATTGCVRYRVACYRPRGIVYYGGRLFVTEVNRNRVAVLDAADGRAVRWLRCSLSQPRGIDVDARGHLVVADSGNNRVVCMTRDGCPLWVRGGFHRPNDVCCTPRLLVSEWGARRVSDVTSTCRLPGQPVMLSTWGNLLLVCDDLLHEVHLVRI